MIEPSLAVQKTIFQRLDSADVVPNGHVFDKAGRPERFPCVILGQAFSTFPDYSDSFHTVTTADVHVWTEEDNLVSVKEITGLVREALWHGPWTVEGHRCVNLRVEQARFMRDVDAKYSHAVLTVTAILQEDAQPR